MLLSVQEMITWCFNLTQSTRICSLRANKVPRMAETILRLLPSIAAAEDIVMFNLGAWYVSGHMFQVALL